VNSSTKSRAVRHAERVRSEGFAGEVVLPGEPRYEQLRRVWNAMVDRQPAIILRCATVGDVTAAVRFGRMADLEIGVRCGGHSVLGLSVPDGGLMIDLRPLGRVTTMLAWRSAFQTRFGTRPSPMGTQRGSTTCRRFSTPWRVTGR
jgi:hypothetical protein